MSLFICSQWRRPHTIAIPDRQPRPATCGRLVNCKYAMPLVANVRQATFGSNVSVQLSWHVGFTPNSGRMAATQRADASGQFRKSDRLTQSLRWRAAGGPAASWSPARRLLQVHPPPTAVKLKEFLFITDAELCAAAADHAEPREHGPQQRESGGLRTGSALLVAVL
jgi:hypothetical protein